MTDFERTKLRNVILFCFINLIYIKVGNGKLATKLVSGRITEIGDFPYVVSLRIPLVHACAGSIIDARHVLTAAHCVLKGENIFHDITVDVGIIDLRSRITPNRLYAVIFIIVHEDYKESKLEHDIAILTVESSIIFTDYVKPIILPATIIPLVGLNATVVGWGSYILDSDRPSRYQRHLQMIIQSFDICRYMWPSENLYIWGHLCAMGKFNHILSDGDSGGPLIHGDMIIGIVCASGTGDFRNYPTIFTRVDHYKNWIKQKISRY